jgi:hypothetical protein
MTDYKASDIAGYKWRRCKQIVIKNYINTLPVGIFLEEDCVSFGNGEVVTKEISELQEAFSPSNINEEFKVLDMDGNDTGTKMTYGQVYVVLKSLYMHLAEKRDTPVVVTPPPVLDLDSNPPQQDLGIN